MTKISPNTKLTPVGFPQRLYNKEKSVDGVRKKIRAQPGETFLAKDHEDPEAAIHAGLIKIVEDEESSPKKKVGK